MMEDPLIENNNGLNERSFDIEENEDKDLDDVDSQMISPTTVIGAAGTEGSVGSDAFTTPLVQYKPHGDYEGLRRRFPPRRGQVKTRIFSGLRDDDDLDEVYQTISPPTVIAEATTDCNLYLGTARTWHTEVLIEDDFINSSLDLAEGVDVVSQMISPPTVIAAAGTEQRITPSSPLPMNTPHRTDIQEGNGNDEEVHGERKGLSKKMDWEWIFVITNIVLEFMSAIFTQLSSKQKPHYALVGMLLSYLALLTCIIELIYKDRRHQQIPIWRRRRASSYCDRPSTPGESSGTLNNIIALACALGQCVVATINYRFGNPIKFTVSPIILAFGVLFSKLDKEKLFN